MSATAGVAGLDVKVNGTELDPELISQLLEVRVDTHLLLPNTAVLRIADPALKYVDSNSFDIGSPIQIELVGSDAATLTTLFDGLITTFEPEFTEEEARVSVRAYDRSHKMNRTSNSATYQQMSAGDIAAKLASRNGLTPGTIDATSPVEFVQQSNETDWTFLWRLAGAIGFEVVVDGEKLHFRKPAPPAGAGVELTWGENLLSFRPRVSGVQQVDSVTVRGWDPVAKQAIVADATSPQLTSSIGVERNQLASAMGGGTVTVVDQPIGNQLEAKAVAEGVADLLANAFVEAEGVTLGDARVVSGAVISVSGVGERFSGSYTLTETTHLIRAGRGYHTQFRVSGRTVRGLLDLGARPAGLTWRNSVVVGIVTNNSGDPANLGRVRVRFPALSDDTEGWWARIASISAGASRGVLMMPQVGDEVLVAFEHGDDEHPYVLGSLWNGQDAPGVQEDPASAEPQQGLVLADGSFALQSDAQILASAKRKIFMKGDDTVEVDAQRDMTLRTQGTFNAQATQDVSVQANQNANVQADQTLTLEGKAGVTAKGLQATVQGETTTKVSGGTAVTVESNGGVTIRGPSITIQGQGVVQISAPQILLG